MKGKGDISNRELSDIRNGIDALAYHKVVEDIRRESLRRKSDSIGQESVDFETAISKAGYGKFNYFLLLIAVPAACSSGFVTGAVSLILPVAGCDLDLSSFEKGLFNCIPYAGMVASAFFWGFLSDAFGRQRLLMIGFLLDALMNFGCSLSPRFVPMLLFKFFSGVMVCGPYSIFMAYISEVFMDKKRDLAVLSAGLFSAMGSTLQPAMAMYLMPMNIKIDLFWGIEITSWRLFLIICGFPSLLCGIGCAFCVESPKFLLEQGRKEEALNVFKKIYTINTGLPINTYPVRNLHDARRPSVISREKNQSKRSIFELTKAGMAQALEVLKPPFLSRALFLFFIQFGSMASLNVVRLWLPEIFTLVELKSGQNNTITHGSQRLCQIFTSNSNKHEASCDGLEIKHEVFMNMIWINAASLFANGVFIFAVRYVGKKAMISTTTLVSAVSALLIPLVSTNFVVLMSSIFSSVLNITFYSLIGTAVETFPTSIRATSVSLAIMFGRIGVLIASIGAAEIMHSHCDMIFYGVFITLTIIGISSFFLSTTTLDKKPEIVSAVIKEISPNNNMTLNNTNASNINNNNTINNNNMINNNSNNIQGKEIA